MFLFLLLSGFVLSMQLPDSLADVNVWVFDGRVVTPGAVDSVMYVNPQFVKRAWFKYQTIPFNFFPLVSNIPPLLNSYGAFFEGGVQVPLMVPDNGGWPHGHPEDPTPPFNIPDTVFKDFVTKDADGNIYWIPNIGGTQVTHGSIANENFLTYCLYWAFEQIDANVNILEFDEINGGYRFSLNGVPANNSNDGYDNYAIGTENFANKITVFSRNDSLLWTIPQLGASSNNDSAIFAFDDNSSTMWVSQVSDSHWIEIDFKRPRTTQQIYIILYPPHILENFSIKYFGAGNWQDFAPPINITSNTDTILSWLVESVSTQRIRLFSPDTQIYLPELQFFGMGFRQYLLEKYVSDSGWTVIDPRWQTQKLVNFSDPNQCPDGTMNSFNYRAYLSFHNWTGNPFGGQIDTSNYLDPPNPFFLDWLPQDYLSALLGYFFEDTIMREILISLGKASFVCQRTKILWTNIRDSVKSYADSVGKEIYISFNGSAAGVVLYNSVDYRLLPMDGKPYMPIYWVYDPVDSMMRHLDGTQAGVGTYRIIKSFSESAGDTIPIVAFTDFGHMGNPFAHIGGWQGYGYPGDERAEYLRSYPFEFYASGISFCFPIRQPEFNAWIDTLSDGTPLIEIIKNCTDFLNANYDIYKNVKINPLENNVKVNGIVPFNGSWNHGQGSPVNASKVTIAYIDAQDETKSYLHIINHNWDSLDYRYIHQDSVPAEIPVNDSIIMLRVISPDFSGEDTLSFTFQSGVVRCTIPELAYYNVLILDLFTTAVKEAGNFDNLLTLENYPNPFHSSVLIQYSIAKEGFVQLKIYNSAGQLIRTLVNEKRKAGNYKIQWDGTDNRNKLLPSGVYFIKLKGGDFSQTPLDACYLTGQTKKLLLLRLRP
ncbi:T9SS type A sorting domain-containing protein [candidate division WOR-3 bacterium]|nr:T9SS type A sorting domain-containing protein [candidate division WOR-3 bacterium]